MGCCWETLAGMILVDADELYIDLDCDMSVHSLDLRSLVWTY